MDDIRITAEPDASGRSCKFLVDRTVHDGTAWFASRDMLVHSPLAEKIFSNPDVHSLLIGGNLVTVTLNRPIDDWRPPAKQIAVHLRDQLRSGVPAVAASYKSAAGNSSQQDEIRRKITQTLDSQINPAIASHGGSISLVDVRGTVVFIQMAGGCQGCASSAATLKLGVENAIRDVAPEVTEIVDVTDHAAGTAPYYAKG
jgi:Fe-S cluster biogenesis protein NfuA